MSWSILASQIRWCSKKPETTHSKSLWTSNSSHQFISRSTPTGSSGRGSEAYLTLRWTRDSTLLSIYSAVCTVAIRSWSSTRRSWALVCSTRLQSRGSTRKISFRSSKSNAVPTKLIRWLRCLKISTIAAKCRLNSISISEAVTLCKALSSPARSWQTERGPKWTNPDASCHLRWSRARSASIASSSRRIQIGRSPGFTHTVRWKFRWHLRPKSTSWSLMCSRRPSSASSTRAPRPQTGRSCRGLSCRRNCSKLRWCASVRHK